MADVELKQLHRRFGEVVALAGIDLDITTGEFVSLLGPSGCGKTTALRLVAGFDRPTSGRVVIDGKDVTDVPPNSRDIGMVFQAYSLFPNMTAVRNVEFGLRVRKQHRADRNRRALELLDLVGLAQAADRYPHQLSGGMQQRVALARALAIEPQVLLLDEPLSALDAKVRAQLRDEIRRIQLGRHHHDLRHPRPGGGPGDRGPGRGHESAAGSSRSGRPQRCTGALRRRSWPSSSAR